MGSPGERIQPARSLGPRDAVALLGDYDSQGIAEEGGLVHRGNGEEKDWQVTSPGFWIPVGKQSPRARAACGSAVGAEDTT